MSKFKNIFVFVLMSLMLVGMTGCEKEGPVEQAGKAVDEAVKDTGDTIKEEQDKK